MPRLFFPRRKVFFQYNVSLASCGNEEVEGQKALMMPIFSKQGLTFNNVSFLCPLSNNKTTPNPLPIHLESPLDESSTFWVCEKNCDCWWWDVRDSCIFRKIFLENISLFCENHFFAKSMTCFLTKKAGTAATHSSSFELESSWRKNTWYKRYSVNWFDQLKNLPPNTIWPTTF